MHRHVDSGTNGMPFRSNGINIFLCYSLFRSQNITTKGGMIACKTTTRSLASSKCARMNAPCFRCFLPLMVFYNIYQSDIREDFNLTVLIFAVASIFVIFFVAVWFTRKWIKTEANQSVIIQAFYWSNYVLFGMEVTRTICGESHMGMASILAAVIIPIYNVLAVILFESYGSNAGSRISILKGIITNPLIIASVLGILVKLVHFTIPLQADMIVANISRLATPLALICLGGTFAFHKVSEYRKELVTACLARLVIVPLIFLIIGILLGFRGPNLAALMVMYASPTAISSYTMAVEMKGNGELAGMIVVFTFVFSIITIFLWVFTLHYLKLL